MALALIVLTVLVSPLRLAAIVPVAVGLWMAATPKRFDIIIDRGGAGAAVRSASGALVTVGRVSPFVLEQWLRADGDGRKPDDAALRAGVRCDVLGCVVGLADGRSVALVQDRRAFAEDCRRAAFVISPLAAPPTCKPPVLLDRPFFAAHGAAALRITPSGHETVTTRRPNEPRPWLQRAEPGSGVARPRDAPSSQDQSPAVPDGEPAEPRLYQ
jgi:competence protein ComEC